MYRESNNYLFVIKLRCIKYLTISLPVTYSICVSLVLSRFLSSFLTLSASNFLWAFLLHYLYLYFCSLYPLQTFSLTFFVTLFAFSIPFSLSLFLSHFICAFLTDYNILTKFQYPSLNFPHFLAFSASFSPSLTLSHTFSSSSTLVVQTSALLLACCSCPSLLTCLRRPYTAMRVKKKANPMTQGMKAVDLITIEYPMNLANRVPRQLPTTTVFQMDIFPTKSGPLGRGNSLLKGKAQYS